MTCWFLVRWYHTWQRREDRMHLTLNLIRCFPDIYERHQAWDSYMKWPENYHWQCPCSAEAKHPMTGIPLKDQRAKPISSF